MIQRLRAQHRATFALLAIVLPIGLWAALGSRRAVPAAAVPSESAGLPETPPARDEIVTAGTTRLRLRVWPATKDGRRVLELTPEQDPELPDVLIYWTNSDATDELPPDCTLLGSLAGAQARRFTLAAEVRRGRLVLYSLAHQEIVASLEFER